MQLSAPASSRYAALLELLRTADVVWNASRGFFARWDLNPSQFNVLNLLRARPDGATQSDLSRELIMHRSNLTSLVDQLEAQGRVERREAPGDRRSWLVVLTPAGRRLLEAVLPAYYAKIDAACRHLPPARARSLAEDLAGIRQRALELARESDVVRT